MTIITSLSTELQELESETFEVCDLADLSMDVAATCACSCSSSSTCSCSTSSCCNTTSCSCSSTSSCA